MLKNKAIPTYIQVKNLSIAELMLLSNEELDIIESRIRKEALQAQTALKWLKIVQKSKSGASF